MSARAMGFPVAELSYLNFDVRMGRKSRQRYPVSISTSLGMDVPSFFQLPFTPDKLQLFLLTVGRPRRSSRRGRPARQDEIKSAEDFGARLFDALFVGAVGECFRTCLMAAEQQKKGLRIRLQLTEAPELADVPWEFLYDSQRRSFLSQNNYTPIVRYLDLPSPSRPLSVRPPLRVLAVIANPKSGGYPELDVEAEWVKLKDALTARSGELSLERLDRPTLATMRRRLLSKEYHVLHFVGHGTFDTSSREGLLIMEDDEGRAEEIRAAEFGAILRSNARSLRLAVLNACEGARADRDDPFAGTAQTLMLEGLPAVIAMQFEISDDAAIAFTDEFYHSLCDGHPVDVAMAQARLNLRPGEFGTEWATPVLYLRSNDARLFDMQPGEERSGEPRPSTGRGSSHLPVIPRRGRVLAGLGLGATIALALYTRAVADAVANDARPTIFYNPLALWALLSAIVASCIIFVYEQHSKLTVGRRALLAVVLVVAAGVYWAGTRWISRADHRFGDAALYTDSADREWVIADARFRTPPESAKHAAGWISSHDSAMSVMLAQYETASSLRPGNAHWRADVGTVLNRLGRYDDAVQKLKTAIELDRDRPHAWYYAELCVALRILRRVTETDAPCLQAIALSPKRVDSLGTEATSLQQLYGHLLFLDSVRHAPATK